jgi:hypothetical protein
MRPVSQQALHLQTPTPPKDEGAPAQKAVELPKLSAAPKFIGGSEPERNDIVVIRRGKEMQELKYKKALPLLQEGWVLVRKKK